MCSVCGEDTQIVYGLFQPNGTAIKRYCAKCAAEELEKVKNAIR